MLQPSEVGGVPTHHTAIRSSSTALSPILGLVASTSPAFSWIALVLRTSSKSELTASKCIAATTRAPSPPPFPKMPSTRWPPPPPPPTSPASASASDSCGSCRKKAAKKEIPKKLALFFDGTGNQFSGTGADTNIVKLYNLCELNTPGQFHYYQPGIGTYTPGSTGPLAPGPVGLKLRKFSQALDSGFGSTFDAHVIAGYRFLMRYYKPDAQVYIFGFSRGAFTARFLASLVSHVGLLSMGNEELIPFAYERYLKAARGEQADMATFKRTFCRAAVTIKFLGLFDSVHSVALFDAPGTGIRELPNDIPIAQNIRHAVALDEGRTKFKPALLVTDEQTKAFDAQLEAAREDEATDTSLVGDKDAAAIVKEEWFVGNHGDIGGGWEPDYYTLLPTARTVTAASGEHLPVFTPIPNTSPPRYTKTSKTTHYPLGADAPVYQPALQLSDLALEWMLGELRACGGPVGSAAALTLNETALKGFRERMQTDRDQALQARRHDCLKWNGGPKKKKVLFWWLLEILPGLKHTELVEVRNPPPGEPADKWVHQYDPNLGSRRDLPHGAVLHRSVPDVRPDGGRGFDAAEREAQKGWRRALEFSDKRWRTEAFRKTFPGTAVKAAAGGGRRWWKWALFGVPLLAAAAVRPVLGLVRREGGYRRID
ncbi:hypothetical protein EDC01DRAFT_791578 [Geopyxis carbonaria]|nr:hypothetical protein EDC01DRAFT_791578 [Geopyxis carbonaria]